MFGTGKQKYSDEKLMVLVAGGDQQAFYLLYQRYKDRLYYYFFRMLNNSPDQANDFLQELFLKIIENPASFNPDYRFSSWIFSIAGNMCKNEYRKRETHGEVITSEIKSSETEEMSFNCYTTEQMIGKVFEVLDQFDPEHRSVFLLRYREGFSIKDISGILNLAEGTVKSRLHYTKKQLSTQLDYLKDEVEF